MAAETIKSFPGVVSENRIETADGFADKLPLISNDLPGSNSLFASQVGPRLAGQSEVIGMNKSYNPEITPRTTNGHAPICQSYLCVALVSFPVLGQLEPQAPLLVVPFRQFL